MPSPAASSPSRSTARSGSAVRKENANTSTAAVTVNRTRSERFVRRTRGRTRRARPASTGAPRAGIGALGALAPERDEGEDVCRGQHQVGDPDANLRCRPSCHQRARELADPHRDIEGAQRGHDALGAGEIEGIAQERVGAVDRTEHARDQSQHEDGRQAPPRRS